jgi:RimJ/RimL family protein N-acetyltransferase
VRFRPARPADHAAVLAVQPAWWGGRDLTGLLQELFFTNFSSTSIVAEDDDGTIAGFLIGFPSVDDPTAAYVHFVGVRPDHRGRGLGADLYARFSEAMGSRGVTTLTCLTGPVNTESIAFHQAIGFEITPSDDEYVHFRKRIPLRRPALVDPRPVDTPWPEALWPVPTGTVLAGRHVTLSITDPDADAAELFAALDHDVVWTHVRGRPSSIGEMAEFVRGAILVGRSPWTVRRGDEVIGMTSYLEVSEIDARLEIGSTAYTPSVWATAVNPECKLLLMTWAFEVANMARVQLRTDIRNTRSQAAITKLGARHEGVLRRFQRRQDGSIRDTVLFSVTIEDWPDVKAGLAARVL